MRLARLLCALGAVAVLPRPAFAEPNDAHAVAARHPALRKAKLPELIPVGEFYADAKATWDYTASPDGKKLAWIGPGDFWSTAYFKALGSSERPRMVKTPRRVYQAAWAEDSRTLLCFWDDDGDENYHLIALDTDKPDDPPRDLTPFGKVQVHLVETFPSDPSSVVIEHNRRDRTVFDLYRLDLRSGEETLVAENPGDVFQWVTDSTGALLARQRRHPDWSWTLEVADGPGWRELAHGSLDDALEILEHPIDRRYAWALSNRERDRESLVRLDLATGAEKVLYEDPLVDLSGAWVDRESYRPLAAWSFPSTLNVHYFDERLGADLAVFRKGGPAIVAVIGWDRTKRFLTVDVGTDHMPHRHWLLDRAKEQRTLLAESSMAEFEDRLSTLEPISFAARDGLTVHGYLMLPKGSAGRNLPMVVRVHGGPWGRDLWGYDEMDQFLANRGYAVLRVNYRGSQGYGRAFMRKGIHESGRKMHTDLVDAVRWAVARGVADPKHVAIFGGSYGGYATLAGLTFTPKVFAAGIDFVGVSDWVTLIENVPPYWKNWMPRWYEYMGDPAKPAERHDLELRSPINFLDRIERPLLVAQGANDVRVIRDHSERVVDTLRRLGKDVDYLVFDDEGHSFRKWENRVIAAERVEHFLAKHLGGRAGAVEVYDVKDLR